MTHLWRHSVFIPGSLWRYHRSSFLNSFLFYTVPDGCDSPPLEGHLLLLFLTFPSSPTARPQRYLYRCTGPGKFFSIARTPFFTFLHCLRRALVVAFDFVLFFPNNFRRFTISHHYLSGRLATTSSFRCVSVIMGLAMLFSQRVIRKLRQLPLA